MISERIEALRREMSRRGIFACVIPTADFHGSEYVGRYFKSREYITGFTGSAGTAVITPTEAGLWTDGRYFLQAERQLTGSGVTLYRSGMEGVPTVTQYLRSALPEGHVLAFDGRCVSSALGRTLEGIALEKGGRVSSDIDLLENVWAGRPALSCEKAWILREEYAGESAKDKLTRVRNVMAEKGADIHLLTSLCDIAWLLNLRGNDVSHVPVILSYLAVKADECLWFVQEAALTDGVRAYLADLGVTVRPYEDFYAYVASIPAGESVLWDPKSVNYRTVNALSEDVFVIESPNPTIAMKAVKNETELRCTREAHIKDAAAMCRFLCWLKTNIGKEPMTEISVSDKLESFRAEQEGYLDLSFDTIAGYNAHGAIIHYSAEPETDAALAPEGLLLVDSGGHYLEGTTDITRTIALGPLTEEMKEYFTLVCRSHIDLAKARFLHGCTGQNLDILARGPLWEVGLDYRHGTGHGVGHLLNVHEGPNGFRWKTAADKSENGVLVPGMITSDEPGLYPEEKFGVRIESELLIREDEKNEYGQFLSFEDLTYVPIDLDALLPEKLTTPEREWLNTYHANVYKIVSPRLNETERTWLKNATRPV